MSFFLCMPLKKAFDNHKLLNQYAKRVDKSSTVGKFAMYKDSFGNKNH